MGVDDADEDNPAAGCIPLERLNSYLGGGPPDALALASALKERNLRLFSELAAEVDKSELDREMPEHGHSSVLYMAVKDGAADFVRELLLPAAAGAAKVNPNRPHKVLKRFPLHVAAENGDLECFRLLLKAGADINARADNGNTALHLLASRSGAAWVPLEEAGAGDGVGQLSRRAQVQGRFAAAIRAALGWPGVNVDCENNVGATPLFLAAKHGTREAVRMLLEAGACITTDVEGDGETVEDLIREKMGGDVLEGLDLTQNRKNKDTVENRLFHLLYFESFETDRQKMGGRKFQQEWEEAEEQGSASVNPDADNGTYTFLQFCCDQGHDRLVLFLLRKGADPNRFCSNYRIPPLVLAAHHGYFKVLQVFKDWGLGKHGVPHAVDFAAVDGIKQENALHKALKRESKAHVNVQFQNYDSCLNVLLDDRKPFGRLMQPAINAQDQLGNSPLHVAALLGDNGTVRKLLRREANIGLKNHRGETPIAHIPPSVLQDFLDDCLQGEGIVSDEQFQLTFVYSFLGPPLGELQRQQQGQGRRKASLEDQENIKNEGQDHEDVDFPEDSAARLRGGQSPATFNYLPEAEPLFYISRLPDHRYLLAHPVIASFLCLKWRCIRPIFYINAAFYTAFVVVFTAFLLLVNIDLDEAHLLMEGPDDGGDRPALPPLTRPVVALMRTSTALLILLTCRELFQALVSVRRYLLDVENLMEVALIVVGFYLVGAGPGRLLADLWGTKCLSAAAILLCWAELVLLVGRHPKCSTFIAMLTTVSRNFALFLTWYISIIIAFGFAFFVVLVRRKPSPPTPEETNGEAKAGQEEEEAVNGYFETPRKSLLKTVVMGLTGEIEFESIDFGGPFAEIIFVLFVFFVMLVLVNLLNGLAVSDIAQIQREAELVSYVSRVELIVFIESKLLGDPSDFLVSSRRSWWRRPFGAGSDCCGKSRPGSSRKRPNIFCRRRLAIQSVFNFFIGSTLLFKDRLITKKAVFLPNRSPVERSLPGPDLRDGGPDLPSSTRKRFITSAGKGGSLNAQLVMDEDILENAKSLLSKRQEKGLVDELSSKVLQMEKTLRFLSKQQQFLLETLTSKPGKGD